MTALIEGLNIIYDEQEERGFIRLNLVALGLMLVVIVAMIVAIGAIILVTDPAEHHRPRADRGDACLDCCAGRFCSGSRWSFSRSSTVMGRAVRRRAGAGSAGARPVATAVWTLGSIAFSIYVQNFGSYNETYGSLGAVVILLMWFWLSAFIVLLGAELNSEMEHQTEREFDHGPAEAARPARRLCRRPRRRGALITLAGLALISSTPAPGLAFSGFRGRPTDDAMLAQSSRACE